MKDADPRAPINRLRHGTRDLHVGAQRSEFGLALIERRLALADYAGQLAAHRPLVRTLEERFDSESDGRFRGVFTRQMLRGHLIDSDLQALAAAGVVPRPALSSAIASYRARLEDRRLRGPELLGHLYVFEGMRSGCGRLVLRLEARIGLSMEMSSYHRSDELDATGQWEAFCLRMNRALADDAHCDRAVRAAREGFERLYGIIDSIYGTVPPPLTRYGDAHDPPRTDSLSPPEDRKTA